MNVDMSSGDVVVVQPETEPEQQYLVEVYDAINESVDANEEMVALFAPVRDDINAYYTLDVPDYPQLDEELWRESAFEPMHGIEEPGSRALKLVEERCDDE